MTVKPRKNRTLNNKQLHNIAEEFKRNMKTTILKEANRRNKYSKI